MRVVALNKFEYDKKLRQPGEEFETTSEKDADILILAQQVKRATIATRAMKAEDEPKPMNTATQSARPERKRYNRRDMRAEE